MNIEIKKTMNIMMESTIDSFMEEHNFKRRKNSLIYTRNLSTSKQKIDMVFFSHPSYHSGALAHIYPWLMVYFPELNKIAKEIVKDANPAVSSMDVTIRQPVEIGFDSQRWMLLNAEDSIFLAEEIKEFLSKYTIPLLDNLTCIEDYIILYEKKDNRLIMDDALHIFITIAYTLKGEYDKAQKVFRDRFGKPGLIKRYESAFHNLEEMWRGLQ